MTLLQSAVARRGGRHRAGALTLAASTPGYSGTPLARKLGRLGFVDVKVCAVSEVWSGLKLVIRRQLRGQPT